MPIGEATWRSWAASGNQIGDPISPVVFVVFSTYTCGYCGRLAAALDTVRQEVPGRLSVVVKHMVHPRDAVGLMLALGAECAADQNRFASFHRAAFSSRRLTTSRDWLALASELGLPDSLEFGRCVSEERFRQRITVDRALADSLKLRATPTSFINGVKLRGSVPAAEVRRNVQAADRR
jgi:protein-disulfide isomerase